MMGENQKVLCVYLEESPDEEWPFEDHNEEVLELVEQLATSLSGSSHTVCVYKEYLRHHYAGQCPILYDVDGTRVSGLRKIKAHVLLRIAQQEAPV